MTTLHSDIPGLVARGSPRREAAPAEADPPDIGTREGFILLFDRYAAALHRYCARRVGPDLAEDIVSQTYLTAFAKRHRYDPARASAISWLYGICTNLLRRHRRDEARALRTLARTGVDPLADSGSVDRSLDRVAARSESRRLAEALASLKAGQREVLLLFAVAELSYTEIAAALRIPEGTVASRIARAKAHLRRKLDDPHPTSRRSRP
ncbi:MAG TPA: RNA polymerase sigma factor [Phytomonospora sp.]